MASNLHFWGVTTRFPHSYFPECFVTGHSLVFYKCRFFPCIEYLSFSVSKSGRPTVPDLLFPQCQLSIFASWLIPQTCSCVIQVLPNERWPAGFSLFTAVNLISQWFNQVWKLFRPQLRLILMLLHTHTHTLSLSLSLDNLALATSCY